ncbi:MAG: FxLYD domain-containing protein [Akkermansia sp.]|nr:FxLYD domain-containing protein [Akkermansia sp.]
MMKYTLINYLKAFLACIAVLGSVCCAAEKFTPIAPTNMFKATTGVNLLQTLSDTEYIARTFLPPETTKEHNYIGYCVGMSEFDDEDEEEKDTVTVYAYCACKRKSNVYDFYYVMMPATPNSHVFHALLTLDSLAASFERKFEAKPLVSHYDTFALKADMLGTFRTLANDQKGSHADRTMKRLRAISAAHAKGGTKKVREILKGKLSEDFNDLCAEDMEKEKDAETEADVVATPATKQAPAPASKAEEASQKDLPITVQNNMPDKIRVGKKIASVVKQSYGYTTVSWLVEITNTSSGTLEFFSITHHILNAAELEIGDSLENVENLKPGETRKVKGSIMVTDDVWAKAASHEFTIES